MQLQQRHVLYVLFGFVIALFLFFRLYKLESSLLFFNDIGRDFLELEEWRETGLPPLLGPQTSALPFNQSAFYFYLLYPGYLLSGLSPFSSVYTLVVIYVALFGAGFLFFMKKKAYQWAWLILCIGALVSLHPQAIIQNRFVWNPSFAFPATIVAFMAWLWGQKEWSKGVAIVWGIASAAAVSFSYSVAPTILILVLLLPFFYRIKSGKPFWLILSSIIAGAFLNAPTFLFELRHNFTLTQLLLHGQKLPQSGLEWSYKLSQLLHYLTGIEKTTLAISLAALFFLAVAMGVFSWHQRKLIEARNRTLLTTLLFITVLVFTVVVPIAVQTHYIFGLVALVFVVIGFLPKRISVPLIIVAAAAWLQPPTLTYFKPAFRTVQQMEQCFAQVCQDQGTEPLFVSVQAGFHPFHNGPEHRYLLKKAGCQVRFIERDPNAANYMAVVVDASIYEHNKTAYNELTLFGPSVVSQTYQCQENFEVLLLEKLPHALTENP